MLERGSLYLPMPHKLAASLFYLHRGFLMTQDAENTTNTMEKTADSPLPPNPPKLNTRHKKFIKARLSGKSGTESYMTAYSLKEEQRESAYVGASRLLSNVKIAEAIERGMDESLEAAQTTLNIAMEEAASSVVGIMQDGTKEDGTRLRAAEYIIDRGLGKPKTTMDVDQTVHSDLNINLQLPEDLDIDKLV